MNKQELLLNTNNITKIQKSLSECLLNGKDAVTPCIEFFQIPKEYRSDTAVEMVVMVLQTFKSFISFLNMCQKQIHGKKFVMTVTSWLYQQCTKACFAQDVQ